MPSGTNGTMARQRTPTARPLTPNRGVSRTLITSPTIGVAMPTSPVTIGRNCEVGSAVRLTENCERAAVMATATATKRLWPDVEKLPGESLSAAMIEKSTNSPPTIDDTADTASPLRSSALASPCSACSSARLRRTTNTPLTFMSANPPTAASAVKPSHVPYPSSPR